MKYQNSFQALVPIEECATNKMELGEIKVGEIQMKDQPIIVKKLIKYKGTCE